MDSIAEPQDVLDLLNEGGEPSPPADRRIMKIKLTKLRPSDEQEPEIEVDAEADIESLVLLWLDLHQELDFAEQRAKRAADVLSKAKERLEKMEDFVSAKIKEYVEANRKPNKKSVDYTPPSKPDLKIRLGLRAQPLLVIVEDEAAVISHYTKGALPTDTELGPCELIPEYWKLHKTKLNELVKEGAEIPGVAVVARGDAAYFKEV